MSFIHLTTFIQAPVERVFDLSRSIDLHKKSMARFNEKPVNGKISGLLGKDEEVTWEAKHLFKKRILKVKMTALQSPHSFIDEQVEGDFLNMKHEHFFKPCDNGTIMIDQFNFDTPYGVLGKCFNSIYLNSYLRSLLEERNKVIKEVAESNRWKNFLN